MVGTARFNMILGDQQIFGSKLKNQNLAQAREK